MAARRVVHRTPRRAPLPDEFDAILDDRDRAIFEDQQPARPPSNQRDQHSLPGLKDCERKSVESLLQGGQYQGLRTWERPFKGNRVGRVGKQPSGLDISKKGDLAPVTNRVDNSISILFYLRQRREGYRHGRNG
jgi:hypothetical protein